MDPFNNPNNLIARMEHERRMRLTAGVTGDGPLTGASQKSPPPTLEELDRVLGAAADPVERSVLALREYTTAFRLGSPLCEPKWDHPEELSTYLARVVPVADANGWRDLSALQQPAWRGLNVVAWFVARAGTMSLRYHGEAEFYREKRSLMGSVKRVSVGFHDYWIIPCGLWRKDMYEDLVILDDGQVARKVRGVVKLNPTPSVQGMIGIAALLRVGTRAVTWDTAAFPK